MEKIRLILMSFFASLITTLFILAISFVRLLFSNRDPGFYTTYFESIFIQIVDTYPEPYIHLDFGLNVGYLTAIWLTFLICGLFYFLIGFVYLILKKRKLVKQ